MFFMVNTDFVHYLDQLENLTDFLDVSILMDKTSFEQTLPISLNASNFDMDLLTALKTMKDFVCQYYHKKENFDLKKGIPIQTQICLTKFLFQQFHYRCFSVLCCDNFTIGYNYSNVHTM